MVCTCRLCEQNHHQESRDVARKPPSIAVKTYQTKTLRKKLQKLKQTGEDYIGYELLRNFETGDLKYRLLTTI